MADKALTGLFALIVVAAFVLLGWRALVVAVTVAVVCEALIRAGRRQS